MCVFIFFLFLLPGSILSACVHVLNWTQKHIINRVQRICAGQMCVCACACVCVSACLYFFILSYQIPHWQHVIKLRSHWIVLHGHEDSVENDADGDTQVHKRVHHHKVHPLLKEHPGRTAIPLQKDVRKLVPARGTWPLKVIKFCQCLKEVWQFCLLFITKQNVFFLRVDCPFFVLEIDVNWV